MSRFKFIVIAVISSAFILAVHAQTSHFGIDLLETGGAKPDSTSR
jgi:hypothetical protein